MEVINGFRNTLKDLMKENELTAVALAQELGISRYVVLKWKNGFRNPKLSSLLKLAEYFNCSLEFLCGKTNDYLNYVPKPCPKFGDWIEVILERNHTTSYQLFKNTCIAPSQYHYWRKGAEPLLTSLEIVANYLEITLDELAGRER